MVSTGRIRMTFAPTNAPIKAATMPTGTIRHTIELLFIKFLIAATVPMVLTNFSCANATCGGNPTIKNAGIKISPAPPAIAST